MLLVTFLCCLVITVKCDHPIKDENVHFKLNGANIKGNFDGTTTTFTELPYLPSESKQINQMEAIIRKYSQENQEAPQEKLEAKIQQLYIPGNMGKVDDAGNKSIPVVVWFGDDSASSIAKELRTEDVNIILVYHKVSYSGHGVEDRWDMYRLLKWKKQKFVLRWVVRNIAKFGGDPSRMTVAGHGKEAADLMIHMQTRFFRQNFKQSLALDVKHDFPSPKHYDRLDINSLPIDKTLLRLWLDYGVLKDKNMLRPNALKEHKLVYGITDCYDIDHSGSNDKKTSKNRLTKAILDNILHKQKPISKKLITSYYTRKSHENNSNKLLRDYHLFTNDMPLLQSFSKSSGQVYFYHSEICEDKLKTHIGTYLKTFVSFGNIGSSVDHHPPWPQLHADLGSYHHLHITQNSTNVKDVLLPKPKRLWTHLYKPQNINPQKIGRHSCPVPRRGEPTGDYPIVNTDNGLVQGVARMLDDERHEEFLGISYAVPPVGNLRWSRPEKAASWDPEIFNASEFGPHCMQGVALLYPMIGIKNTTSEDCLTINVWVPGSVDDHEVSKLPVMFFILGGAHMLGASEMYPGPGLAVGGDVVVVVFNYRVNAFGWMSTMDTASKGNYGLWDASLALQWVQANIESFGGDRTRVTVFGQSAGGMGTCHALLSPVNAGLRHRGICMSGGATTGGAWNDRALEITKALADGLLCPLNNTQEMVDCMREVDADTLLTWSNFVAPVVAGDHVMWQPVIDQEYIPGDPRVSWAAGLAADIDFMTGNAHHDNYGFVIGNPLGLNYSIDIYNVSHKQAMFEDIREGLHRRASDDLDGALEAVKFQYPNLDSDDFDTRFKAFVQSQTDWSFGYCSHEEAVLHSGVVGKTGTTYRYEYKYNNDFLRYPHNWVEGSHLDDIYSIFGEPFMRFFRDTYIGGDFSENDKRVRDNMMQYFANFAYTGNPNNGPFTLLERWDQYSTGRRMYMELKPEPELKLETLDQLSRYDFWMNVLPLPPPEAKRNVEPGKAWGMDVDSIIARMLQFQESVEEYDWPPEIIQQAQDSIDKALAWRERKLIKLNDKQTTV